MKEKINILHLCSWFPHRANLFDGNFVVKHIRVLNDDVTQIALAVYEDENLTKDLYEFDEGVMDGFPFLVIYHQPFSSNLLKIIFRFFLYWKGIRYLKKKIKKIDLIHVHVLQFAGVFTWLYTLFSKIPYVITEHSTFFQQDPNQTSLYLKWILKKAAGKSSFLLPVSNNLAGQMRRFGIVGDFEVIANIVNTDLFRVNNENKKSTKLRFLHISSFHKMKNIPGILRVIKKLSDVRTDFTFTIAGEGYVQPFLVQKEALQISDDILCFIGEMTEKQVAEQMQLHDVFVLFSDYENLPCVLLEAQSSGMPIVTTDVGGIAEIMTSEKYGFMIKPQDEEALFDALNNMIDHFDYDRALIRKHGESMASERVVKSKILDIYNRVLPS